jgi:hypothetical protein
VLAIAFLSQSAENPAVERARAVDPKRKDDRGFYAVVEQTGILQREPRASQPEAGTLFDESAHFLPRSRDAQRNFWANSPSLTEEVGRERMFNIVKRRDFMLPRMRSFATRSIGRLTTGCWTDRWRSNAPSVARS